MGAPFGFMAFLGIVSLIGVIVSHVIVLFDFIEEMHAEGEPLSEALLDAGIIRCGRCSSPSARRCSRLVPLAIARRAALGAALLRADRRPHVRHGLTLLLVPVIYAIFVLDLKIVKWENIHAAESPQA